MKILRILLYLFGLLAFNTAALAQTDKWFVGSHPDYHAALVRNLDGVFVAVYVTKQPSQFATPMLLETMAPTCDTKKPIEMHSTQAIMAFGATAEIRLAEARAAVEGFLDRSVRSCPIADDFETRFFHRFDDAYFATDALLVEAGVFPLSSAESVAPEESGSEQEDSSD